MGAFAIDLNKVRENANSFTFYNSSYGGKLIVIAKKFIEKTEIVPVQVTFDNGNKVTYKMRKFYLQEWLYNYIIPDLEKMHKTKCKIY
jgi:hypothetical protein